MHFLHLCIIIAICSITSALPHPSEGPDIFPNPDLGSDFDIFTSPTTAEEDTPLIASAECRVDENLAKPPDSDTVLGAPFGAAGSYPLDIDLLNSVFSLDTSRTAPPCGPDGTHHQVCCLGEWGGLWFLTECVIGMYTF